MGYTATEHGHQGDTVDIAYELMTRATTHRGLYVGATRGRAANQVLVVTDTSDPHGSPGRPRTRPGQRPSQHPRRRPTPPPRRPDPTVSRPSESGVSRSGSSRPNVDSSSDETTLHAQLDQTAEGRAAKRGLDLAALPARTRHGPRRVGDLRHRVSPRSTSTSTSACKPALWDASHDERHASIGRRRGARHRLAEARPRRPRRRSDRPRDRDQRRTLQAAPRPAHRSNPHAARHRRPGPGRAPTSTTSTASSSPRSNASSTTLLDTWQHRADGRPLSPGALTAAVETITDAGPRPSRLLATGLDDLTYGRDRELLPRWPVGTKASSSRDTQNSD